MKGGDSMEFKKASDLFEYLKSLEERVEKAEEVLTSQSKSSKDESPGEEEEEEKKQDEEEVPSEEEINEIDALLNLK